MYAHAQSEAVTSFFNQNSYVEYCTLEQMGVAKPKMFLRDAFPDGIALESVFVSPTITAQV